MTEARRTQPKRPYEVTAFHAPSREEKGCCDCIVCQPCGSHLGAPLMSNSGDSLVFRM